MVSVSARRPTFIWKLEIWIKLGLLLLSLDKLAPERLISLFEILESKRACHSNVYSMSTACPRHVTVRFLVYHEKSSGSRPIQGACPRHVLGMSQCDFLVLHENLIITIRRVCSAISCTTEWVIIAEFIFSTRVKKSIAEQLKHHPLYPLGSQEKSLYSMLTVRALLWTV